jgi:hypothetical protein
MYKLMDVETKYTTQKITRTAEKDRAHGKGKNSDSIAVNNKNNKYTQ